ncbi:MAG: hypothetical protein ACR2RV_01675, partial [Verrucomicrobiales bacterium]
DNTVYRQFPVEEELPKFIDLRLNDGLDPGKHFAQARQAKFVTAGDVVTIDDLRSTKLEIYDNLGDVFQFLQRTQGGMVEWSFLLNWPKLEDAKKEELYSKYASHELNFCIAEHDPAFFAKIAPYLANKKDKTFLDQYLVGADLKEFLKPWEYSRLNTVERVLLAGRLGGDEPKATARHLSDQLELMPVDRGQQDFLFATAIAGKALGLSRDAISLSKAQLDDGVVAERLLEEAEVLESPMEGAVAATVAAAPSRGLMRRKAKGLEQKSESLGRMQEAKKRSVRFARADNEMSNVDAFGIQPLKEIESRMTKVRQFYRKLEATKEWAENNYYHLLIAQQNAELVGVSAFWTDYANHVATAGEGQPFLSSHFTGAQRNFTEMMFAMSVIGLPYQSGEHAAEVEGTKLSIKTASPAIVIHREINEAPISDDKTPLLVSQNYFLHHDRYEQRNGEKIDKFVNGEFLAGAVYGCQVVATNPTSGKQRLELLVQIPRGAVPVLNARETRGQRFELEPYHTETFEYAFYFPLPSGEGGGNLGFPAHLARDEKIAAWADAREFQVVAKFSTTDTASWDYLSQHGTPAQVIGRMRDGNTSALQLDRIAWRMKDLDFFRQAIGLLQARHVYDHTLYSYGLYHAEVPAARQFLLHSDSFLNQ